MARGIWSPKTVSGPDSDHKMMVKETSDTEEDTAPKAKDCESSA
jgi:hypothetical protein